MKKTNLSIIALAMTATFVSCSNDNDAANNASSEYINTVRVTVEDFKPETPETRTAYTVENNTFRFSWAEGDALGIYPVGGDQVKFPISAGSGSKSATFDGGSWKLRSNIKYAAYYPFSTANYTIAQTALPVSYTGQTQNGNNSTAHIGAYDYLACAATQPNASGGVDLQMKQLSAFVRLQLTMPKADTYSSVVLESDGAKFVTTGTFDLTAATPAITATSTSSTYTINLTNVSTTAANQMVTVYALVAPVNLSAANIKVTVHGAGQTTYVQTVAGKNFQVGTAYNIAIETFPSGTNASGEDVSWEEPAHAYVDLGLSVKWATMNIGANSPEEPGLFFAWGETSGRTGDGTLSDDRIILTDENKFKWTNAPFNGGNKTYNSDAWNDAKDTAIDSNSNLQSNYDAASVNWSSDWRMPTYADCLELFRGCFVQYTSNYNASGVEGYIIYKAKDEYDKGKINVGSKWGYILNSNEYYVFYYSFSGLKGSYSISDTHIFLPIGGGLCHDWHALNGGYYWLNSLYNSNPMYARNMALTADRPEVDYKQPRYEGMNIRPVFTK